MEEKIKQYKQAIEDYAIGKPSMTDKAFDDLETELIANGIDAIQIRIDAQAETPRRWKMSTLEKRPLQDVLDFLSKYECRIEPKYDGVAIELVYHNNEFAQALSRSGTDYTATIRKVLPEAFENSRYNIYAEVVISLSTDLPKKYKNRRNAVAGILNALEPSDEDVALLDIVPYAIGTQNELVPVGMHYTNKQNSKGIQHVTATEASILDVKSRFDELVDFETDGIVIKADDIHVKNRLGFSGTYRWQFCYKFQDETVETKLKHIEWTVSSNGKLTPVAHFEPVTDEIGTMSKASLASLSKLERLDIKHGSTLTIKRANKIIPHIVAATGGSEKISIPDIIEGKRTYVEGANLFIDKALYDDTMRTIKHQIAVLGAKNITSNKVQKAIDDGAKDIFEFYAWLEHNNDRVIAKLENLKNDRTPGEWLMFLDLPGYGFAKQKEVDKAYSDLDTLVSVYRNRKKAPTHPSVKSKPYFKPALEKTMLRNIDMVLNFVDSLNKFKDNH